MQAGGLPVLGRRIQAVVHLLNCELHTHTVVGTPLYGHDDGQGMEKMGHKHVSWHGNIAMGLHEIARSRGRFEGVNRRISGKSSGLELGVDFVRTLRGW